MHPSEGLTKSEAGDNLCSSIGIGKLNDQATIAPMKTKLQRCVEWGDAAVIGMILSGVGPAVSASVEETQGKMK